MIGQKVLKELSKPRQRAVY